MATYADFITKLSSRTAQRLIKIERLDDNENVISELESNIIDGDIQSTDNSGSRTNANVVLENTQGLLIPTASGYIWMNKKFKISTGLIMDDNTNYYISRGVFLVSEPEISSLSDASNSISIQFLDKFSLLNGGLGGVLETTYKIPSGTSIVSAVQSILTDAGEIKPPIIEPTSETLPYTLVKQAGSTYGDMLIELANMLSWNCYFNENGYFCFEPINDISTGGSKWDFTTNEIHYLGSTHRYEFTKVFNNIVVWGANVNGNIANGTASDTNITSDTRIALIGKKTLVINDDLISTDVLAQTRADAELLKNVSLVETNQINAIPIDMLSGGDIITIIDTSSGLNADRFLIKQVSFPLSISGDMGLQAWKGRSLT